MNSGIEARPTEKQPERFRWRNYLRHPERISPESATKLDMLADLLQGDAPANTEFMEALRNGEFRGQPVLAFVQFFRDALESKERTQLRVDIKQCDPVGWDIEEFRDTSGS